MAAANDHISVAKILTDAGASPDSCTNNGLPVSACGDVKNPNMPWYVAPPRKKKELVLARQPSFPCGLQTSHSHAKPWLGGRHNFLANPRIPSTLRVWHRLHSVCTVSTQGCGLTARGTFSGRAQASVPQLCVQRLSMGTATDLASRMHAQRAQGGLAPFTITRDDRGSHFILQGMRGIPF